MAVLELSRILFFVFFSLGFFGKKETLDVPRIQRAVVTEHQAIVYKQPDFDAEQIMRLPHNRIVAVSTKIYRPKNLFGSFYRIFINKPRKIRGYVSEIDVLPQYKKSKEGYFLNKEYQKKEKALKQVKTEVSTEQKQFAPPKLENISQQSVPEIDKKPKPSKSAPEKTPAQEEK